MGIISPIKSSDKTVTLKHWQRVWIDRHGSINFSGLVQEMITEVIRMHDPAYYTKHKQYLDISQQRKKEIINQIVKTTPIIMKT
jgi:hypothetical protein